jgi:hypothetical protein
MSDTTEDFDWDTDVESIVQQEVSFDTVAIYPNPRGDVVIREAQWGIGSPGDKFIVIARENALSAAQAILRAAEIEVAMADGGLSELLMLPKHEPMSGAERQRSYRNRHRNDGDADRHESDELPSRTLTETEESQLRLIAAE